VLRFRDERVTGDEEADWLADVLVRIEKEETFFLIAEVDGRVVASSDIDRRKGYERHVGVVGIGSGKEFRGLGIGIAMMYVVLQQEREMGLRILTLSAFASNRRAIHVYEKVGFFETGLMSKKYFKEGRYIDEVIMTKLSE
jgi:putative acetyltransferase